MMAPPAGRTAPERYKWIVLRLRAPRNAAAGATAPGSGATARS